MNIDRIIRVTSGYLFLTGYQIYWYDHKKLHYRLTVVGTLYYLILYFLYLICFGHHFEEGYLLEMLKELSPFLYQLMRLQVFFGLIAFIVQIFESKTLRNVLNSLIHITHEEIMSLKNFDMFEMFVYLMFFVTLLPTLTIGLYIAIELEFVLPPLDQFMIYMALCMPHFSLAGCLRLYTLCLWFAKRKFVNLRANFKTEYNTSNSPERGIVLEILNPVASINLNDEILLKKFSKRLDALAEFFSLFDNVLQRQLVLLVGLNLNCLLTGVYCYVNYENTWKVLFTTRNQRIFYAASSGIFVCILMDYSILLFSCLSFCRAKRSFYNLIEQQLFANKHNEWELQTILYKLSKTLKPKLFCLVKFNFWNFITFQGLTILIIAVIVSYQSLNDQIKMLNENFAVHDTD